MKTSQETGRVPQPPCPGEWELSDALVGDQQRYRFSDLGHGSAFAGHGGDHLFEHFGPAGPSQEDGTAKALAHGLGGELESRGQSLDRLPSLQRFSGVDESFDRHDSGGCVTSKSSGVKWVRRVGIFEISHGILKIQEPCDYVLA